MALDGVVPDRSVTSWDLSALPFPTFVGPPNVYTGTKAFLKRRICATAVMSGLEPHGLTLDVPAGLVVPSGDCDGFATAAFAERS
jgi:hypothetical protein